MLLKSNFELHISGKDGPEYEPTGIIDPHTGTMGIAVKVKIVKSGEFFECHEPLASELLEKSKGHPAYAIVSIPDERELLLWRMANGQLVEKAEG